ncbi:MAG: hypothetical protein F6J98_03985 [Moorea sp. SIO4G2]|nr:hypothetical protein [Moorena sp. SIO4A3]NEO59610.1 hypothetical protein [Moorena sp. SIO4G2]NEQ80566.1 hypothetical protein [Moorena sp. SIO2I5]
MNPTLATQRVLQSTDLASVGLRGHVTAKFKFRLFPTNPNYGEVGLLVGEL